MLIYDGVISEFFKEIIPFAILFIGFIGLLLFLGIRPIINNSLKSKAHKIIYSLKLVIFVVIISVFLIPIAANFIEIIVDAKQDLTNSSYVQWEGYVGETRKQYWAQVEIGGYYFYISKAYWDFELSKGDYCQIVIGEKSGLIVSAEKTDSPK